MTKTISKTFYQPIGLPFTGKSAGSEIAPSSTCGLYPGLFLSISIAQCCEVDRVKSVNPDGTFLTYGSRTGDVTIQPLADLSGCWLQLDVTPPPSISLGIVCASPKGVLLDRSFPECAMGRLLSVGSTSLGSILGATVMPDGRSVLSVENPVKVDGVGVASVGNAQSIKGKRSGRSPFVTLNGSIPTIGTAKLSLFQGWRSSKPCIPDVISYGKTLCEGELS